jgi:branched-subunit amino acid aminotransferase/4-amino-4-deoxychorismate lyase
VLEGIRVELLRELCEDVGIAYNLRPISEADVLAADEVLLSSATKEVLAVTRIDGEACRPRRAARQARPGVRAAVRGLPARQADDVDLSSRRCADDPARAA